MGKESGSGEVSQQDVLQVLEIIDRFEQSGAGFLRVEVGDLKVVLSKSGQSDPTFAPTAPAVAASAPATAPAPSAPAAAAGTVEIKSPMVGRFYVAPRPGAPPFVSVGSLVADDTTVCLIEVMKLFNAVKAGVRGEIVEVCVADSQFVEYEQVLFRVKSDAGLAANPTAG